MRPPCRGNLGPGNREDPLPDAFLPMIDSERTRVDSRTDEARRVVICADDFGMNAGIDAGILDLGRRGVLQATSCLVEGPSFSLDAPALRESGLQTGLHLNFTEALGAEGLFLPLGKLIASAYLRRLDAGRLHSQIVRQLDRFEAVMGRAPDFVDGHQHVHQLPQIREALLDELSRRYPDRKPWLRYTAAAPQPAISMRLRFKAFVIEVLGSRRLARLARRNGFGLNRGFLGVYDFQGGEQGYAQLLRAWLAHAREGDLLMCHPAARAEADDGLGMQRVAEYRVLATRNHLQP